MKISKFKIITIFCVIALMIGFLGTKVSALSLPPADNAYDLLGNKFYCMNRNGGLSFQLKVPTKNGSTITVADTESLEYDFYVEYKDGEIEPTVAYAFYYCEKNGINLQSNENYRAQIQNIFWNSKTWDPHSKMVYYGYQNSLSNHDLCDRVERFGVAYYGLLKNLTTDNLSNVVKADATKAKVLIDQQNKDYIIGPYTLYLDESALPINTSHSKVTREGVISVIREELKSNNPAAFAKANLSGLSGNYTLVDSNGKSIPGPGLESKFYVKYHVNDINSFNYKPENLNINLSFIKNFRGTVFEYHGNKVKLKTLPNLKGKDVTELNWGLVKALNMVASVTDIEKPTNHKEKYYTKEQIYLMKDKDGKITGDYTGKITFKLEGQFWAKLGIVDEGVLGANPIVTIKASIKKTNREMKAGDTRTRSVQDDSGEYLLINGKLIRIRSENRYSYVSVGANNYQYVQSDNGNYLKYDGAYWKIEAYNRYTYREETYMYWPDLSIAEKLFVSWVEDGNAESRIEDTTYDLNNTGPYIQEIAGYGGGADADYITAPYTLPTKDVNLQIGGNVFKDLPSPKSEMGNGRYENTDEKYGGIMVELVEYVNGKNDKVVATTLTDKNGKYRFYGRVNGKYLINPFKKYFVRFIYNGQLYQPTYYKNCIAEPGGYSNAKTSDSVTTVYNTKFGTINSDTDNFVASNGKNAKAFSFEEKIKLDNGDYIAYGNNEALRFSDVWAKFEDIAKNKMTDAGEPDVTDMNKEWNRSANYDQILAELETWLRGLGVNKQVSQITTFIKECMIKSSTGDANSYYPQYTRYVAESIDKNSKEYKANTQSAIVFGKQKYTYIYTKHSDQARYVDFGLSRRLMNDLALQKDVYKATVIVNGKKEDYIYSKKNLDEDGAWQVKVRASDNLYNGVTKYERAVHKSEYLNKNEDVRKDLRVLITYRIAIRNMGQVNATINEIVDHYDADSYTFDGTQNGNTLTPKVYNEYDNNGNVKSSYVNSYIGNIKGEKVSDIALSTKSIRADHDTKLNGYSNIYIRGLENNVLKPGQLEFAYITFEVNKDSNGRIKLDEDNQGRLTSNGKRNIAEINSYSTYYKDGTKIPNYIKEKDGKTELVDTIVKGDKTKIAGLIDSNSNPGSLTDRDLYQSGENVGRIITSTNPVEDRQENDTDQATNIRIIIDKNEEDTRTVKGYVFEDERNKISNKAVVGDGKADSTRINGVTVQLVELVQNVDENGMSMNTYSGEKVWGSYKLDNNLNVESIDDSRYASGSDKSKVIITGPEGTIFEVKPSDLTLNNGEYEFKSMVAGDYIVRFTYGDTDDTVLTNSDNEVNTLLGKKGLNAKSYNGQDYKSTTYQVGVEQSGSYKGINGFVNYETQNGYTDGNVDKAKLFYYDTVKSEAVRDISDAKDVYANREAVNAWSMGIRNESGKAELLNTQAEILASFEKVSTYAKGLGIDQIDTIKEYQNGLVDILKAKTKMVAETGVINAEVEKNLTVTDENHPYLLDDIDLGLEERPEAQVKLNKEVANFKITLANNEVLFDTNQSVKNLFFAKHKGHTVNYTNKDLRLANVAVSSNSRLTPELLQTYMDDELMEGATLNTTYRLVAENVGEVDYLDKQFYYTGVTNNTSEDNIAKVAINKVVDYVTNNLRYDETKQLEDADWKVVTSDDLSKNQTNDLVSYTYKDKLNTYETLLLTEKLGGELTPRTFDKNKSLKETSLVLSTLMSASNALDNLVYNNLAEVVSTTNTVGRRMQYSISGNQEMADQSLGNTASSELITNNDLVTPSEIDADSAQKIVIMPPTGENLNILPIIGALLAAAGLIICGVALLLVANKKANSKKADDKK